MTQLAPAVTHGTFVIERSFKVAPERVYAAFADPARKRRWIADERGMAVEAFEMDFRAGGREYARYRFPEESRFPGATLTNETIYLDIVPNRRIVIAYTMAIGDHRFSASLATFELLPTGQGTALVFTDQGAYFENADGPRIREEGWRGLLERLAGGLA
jgi:uncharacterized protein YndB with AHSA1/START domain